jgi:hypothetical protein
MLWLLILVGTVVGATIHCIVRRERGNVVEVYLVYLLAGYYGLSMLLAAFVHLTNPGGIAQLKGWASSEPIQALYAFALLGMAVSSILSVWMRGTYLLGPALFGSILLLGGAFVHGREVLQSGTFAWAKDGLEFLFDLIVPIAVLGLACAHKWGARRRRTSGCS